jgi:hypothetical protein
MILLAEVCKIPGFARLNPARITDPVTETVVVRTVQFFRQQLKRLVYVVPVYKFFSA